MRRLEGLDPLVDQLRVQARQALLQALDLPAALERRVRGFHDEIVDRLLQFDHRHGWIEVLGRLEAKRDGFEAIRPCLLARDLLLDLRLGRRVEGFRPVRVLLRLAGVIVERLARAVDGALGFVGQFGEGQAQVLDPAGERLGRQARHFALELAPLLDDARQAPKIAFFHVVDRRQDLVGALGHAGVVQVDTLEAATQLPAFGLVILQRVAAFGLENRDLIAGDLRAVRVSGLVRRLGVPAKVVNQGHAVDNFRVGLVQRLARGLQPVQGFDPFVGRHAKVRDLLLETRLALRKRLNASFVVLADDVLVVVGDALLELGFLRGQSLLVPQAREIGRSGVSRHVGGQEPHVDRFVLEGVEDALAPRLRGLAHEVVVARVAPAHGAAYGFLELLTGHIDPRLFHVREQVVVRLHPLKHQRVDARARCRFDRRACAASGGVHVLVKRVFGELLRELARTGGRAEVGALVRGDEPRRFGDGVGRAPRDAQVCGCQVVHRGSAHAARRAAFAPVVDQARKRAARGLLFRPGEERGGPRAQEAREHRGRSDGDE